MATWKKMAEAFGRAMHNPKVTDTQVEHFARLAERSPETERAFIKGLDEGEDIGRRVSVDDLDPDADIKLERQFDDEIDDLTNKNLRQNASDEWDKAFAERKAGVKKWYGKDYPQDMAEEGAESFEKLLWEYVDQLRAEGVPAQDILNRLKGNN